MLSVLFTSSSAAVSDWLVLTDGSRVETAGPWEERGDTVVFTLPDGTLSSLQAGQVDLEASRGATAEAERAQEPEEPPEPSRREPILVLTDADVPKARPAPDTGSGEGSGPAPSEGSGDLSGPEPSALGLTVTESRLETREAGGYEVRGMVVNQSANRVADARVTAILLDARGRELGRRNARMRETSLGPGESIRFETSFPDTMGASSVDFEFGGMPFVIERSTPRRESLEAESEAAAESSPPQGEGRSATAAESSSLRVTDWRRSIEGEGATSIVGEIENVSDQLVRNVRVTVRLLDDSGSAVAANGGEVDETVLRPGQTTYFVTRFRGDPSFTEVEFRLSGETPVGSR